MPSHVSGTIRSYSSVSSVVIIPPSPHGIVFVAWNDQTAASPPRPAPGV